MAIKKRTTTKANAKSAKQLKADCEKLKKDLNKSVVRDIEILCMHDKFIDAKTTSSLWEIKGNITPYLHNFIIYNREALKFLEIEYSISPSNMELILKASQMVGSVPLISPVTGKQCGNLIVKSEYQEELNNIIPLIKGDIDLVYRKDLPLNTSPFVNPPIYLECIKFIEEWTRLNKNHWRKFANYYLDQNIPAASTDWTKYGLRSYDPNMRLKYPNRINRLVCDHPEWLELMYVLSIAIEELQIKSTTYHIQHLYMSHILRCKQEIPYQKIKPVKELKIHKSDPENIQKIKRIGNNILKNKTSISCAWAFNITKLFERYVQYIFGEVMVRLGGKAYFNSKYSINGDSPAWSLNYLEPDIILSFKDKEVIVDAKYKSHMMNLRTNSDTLRNSFREDLHQVLAYSSLCKGKNKTAILCYPNSSLIHKKLKLKTPHNNSECVVFLIGVPINKTYTNEIIRCIYENLSLKDE